MRPIAIIFVSLGFFVILPMFLVPRLGLALDVRGRTLIALGGTLLAELTLFGFLWRWLKGQGRSLSDIGWRGPTTLLAVLLGIVFAAAYSAYTLSNPLIGPHAGEISLFKLAGVAVGIIGAFVEECVFRGYIISELQHIKVSTLTQILVSGASFGLVHIGFDLAGVLITFVMGIVMATVYVIGKRSLTPSLISHAAINIVIEPWLLLFIVTMYGRLAQALGR